jgi:hypothetical protein
MKNSGQSSLAAFSLSTRGGRIRALNSGNHCLGSNILISFPMLMMDAAKSVEC